MYTLTVQQVDTSPSPGQCCKKKYVDLLPDFVRQFTNSCKYRTGIVRLSINSEQVVVATYLILSWQSSCLDGEILDKLTTGNNFWIGSSYE